MTGRRSKQRVLIGLGVAPGVAVGPIHLRETGEIRTIDFTVPARQTEDEVKRFDAAVEVALQQLGMLKTKAAGFHGASAEELGYLLDAHARMLCSTRLHDGVYARIRELKMNAEAALMAEITEITQTFEAMADAYLRSRAEEVRQVGYRVLRNLSGEDFSGFDGLPPGTVVIAEEITPADTALMDPNIIAGFASVLGGAEGHTAIMARSLGLPAVLGVTELLHGTEPGATAIIDGSQGLVIINPTKRKLASYRRKQKDFAAQTLALSELHDQPAITKDGCRLTLQANLELPREVDQAVKVGAEGIGLLRTEFLFMNRDDLPDEEEQTAALIDIIAAMDGKPVTVRTLDVGGEKLASALGEHLGNPANPALGLRAIRLSLKLPELLDTQLAAMLRAGATGPVRILLPMVTTLDEVRRVRERLGIVAAALKARGVAIADPLPPLGVMIEVPGAALAADSLARVADFFAIGTNDLIMYTLAIDRGEDQVAELYNPLHPAVLRLIQFSVDAALRNGKPVSVCGEMAGDPRYTGLFLAFGVRELSMSATALPRVKDRIRHLDSTAAAQLLLNAMMQGDPEELGKLLDSFNKTL